MATGRRKTRKLRGSRTHGWGRSGQHRDSGSLGGHGNAGWKRHKWSAVIRYGLQMGSKGFHPISRTTDRAININSLTLQMDSFLKSGAAKQSDGLLEIDLTKAGFGKLLGDGHVNQPLRIIVARASHRALEKISAARGEIVLPTKKKED